MLFCDALSRVYLKIAMALVLPGRSRQNAKNSDWQVWPLE